MRCINIFKPSFPGYFPARFAGDRSNKLAPVSLQIACTSIFFPVPLGPASRIDLVKGACSWTAGEPGVNAHKYYFKQEQIQILHVEYFTGSVINAPADH